MASRALMGFLLLSDMDLWWFDAASAPTPVIMEACDAAEMPPATEAGILLSKGYRPSAAEKPFCSSPVTISLSV